MLLNIKKEIKKALHLAERIVNFKEEVDTPSANYLQPDDSLLYKVIENQTDSDLLQLDLTALETWEET